MYWSTINCTTQLQAGFIILLLCCECIACGEQDNYEITQWSQADVKPSLH